MRDLSKESILPAIIEKTRGIPLAIMHICA